ncbi:MAG: hypothetical protein L3J29_10825 [Cyclobacteriaceae bacterium]|nr:hypothetical protein [Cyclobacteriaceae bacterium]
MKNVVIIYVVIGLISCGNSSTGFGQGDKTNPKVINFDNKTAFNDYRKLNLDSLYPNLLDPSKSSEKEFKAVVKSWSELHQKVSSFMKDEGFSWNVEDSTISIVNKICFHKNGTIDYFFFRILNPSIPDSKKIEFESVLQKFSKSIIMNLNRDSNYAQCGKTKYINY